MHITVELDSGVQIQVRVLGLYELDEVAIDDPGPFTFLYTLPDGQVRPKRYTLDYWPQPPETPELAKELCQEGTVEWAMWNRRDLYEAVLQREIERVELQELCAHDIARYVLETCVTDQDRAKIVTFEDVARVLNAAIVKEVSLQDIADAHMRSALCERVFGRAACRPCRGIGT